MDTESQNDSGLAIIIRNQSTIECLLHHLAIGLPQHLKTAWPWVGVAPRVCSTELRRFDQFLSKIRAVRWDLLAGALFSPNSSSPRQEVASLLRFKYVKAKYNSAFRLTSRELWLVILWHSQRFRHILAFQPVDHCRIQVFETLVVQCGETLENFVPQTGLRN